MQQAVYKRVIKSYVIREGRLTPGQKQALDTLWTEYGVDYRDSPIDWTARFGRQAPLVVEVGFGDGGALLHLAKANPQLNYIGIEVHRPGVGRVLKAVQAEELTNVRVVNHDAVEVLHAMFAPATINTLNLFFPDPWHKKKHNKRRIVQSSFLKLVQSKLVPGGRFHFATDWADYAEYAKAQLADSSFVEVPHDRLEPIDVLRPQTKFEHRGLRLGHEIIDMIVENPV